ncbi:hypothetical protein V1478_014628 [Vespula squamosa]|uniref:Uncharacterized protein n=1 Tax=Vespula squamosa TaxID=30214 RepID=A0ABD2A2T4_VESSQ
MLKVRELRNRFYWGTGARRKFSFFSTTREYLSTLFALMDHEPAPYHCLLARKYYLSIVCFTTAFPVSPLCREKSRERGKRGSWVEVNEDVRSSVLSR